MEERQALTTGKKASSIDLENKSGIYLRAVLRNARLPWTTVYIPGAWDHLILGLQLEDLCEPFLETMR
jgi:hypothetical protein